LGSDGDYWPGVAIVQKNEGKNGRVVKEYCGERFRYDAPTYSYEENSERRLV